MRDGGHTSDEEFYLGGHRVPVAPGTGLGKKRYKGESKAAHPITTVTAR